MVILYDKTRIKLLRLVRLVVLQNVSKELLAIPLSAHGVYIIVTVLISKMGIIFEHSSFLQRRLRSSNVLTITQKRHGYPKADSISVKLLLEHVVLILTSITIADDLLTCAVIAS